MNVDTLRQQVIDRQAAKPGLRGKINAMCCSCIFDHQVPGNWRKQVMNCTVTDCPLYQVRPISKPEKGKE